MADADDQQINLPSLVAILVVSGLIIRYLFFSPPANANNGGRGAGGIAGRAGAGAGLGGAGAGAGLSRDPAAQLRAREAAVERIQQMFPQVDRRAALWDLQRTGGSVAATTERILAGRLETVSCALFSFLLGVGFCLFVGWVCVCWVREALGVGLGFVGFVGW